MGVNYHLDFSSYTEEGRRNRARFAKGGLTLYIRDYLEELTTEAIWIALWRFYPDIFNKELERLCQADVVVSEDLCTFLRKIIRGDCDEEKA